MEGEVKRPRSLLADVIDVQDLDFSFGCLVRLFIPSSGCAVCEQKCKIVVASILQGHMLSSSFIELTKMKCILPGFLSQGPKSHPPTYG